MLSESEPAVVLAPMDGITDAPMREFMGESGAFTYSVTEFLRVSGEPLPRKVFLREVPELESGSQTLSGLPVQVQLLGGDPDRMALSAQTAVKAGAKAIDINFGCPAPTVNRHDGGASLLRQSCRIRDIVHAVREALPPEIPVSAKLRLGWDSIKAIFETSEMAAEGGANWLTIHARTRMQGYAPPVYWEPIGKVRKNLHIPVIANGDIWSIDDFRRCQDATGCIHYMLGRSSLSDPTLPGLIAAELAGREVTPALPFNWRGLMSKFERFVEPYDGISSHRTVMRVKQWLKLASSFGQFREFDQVKRCRSMEEILIALT